MTGIVRGGSESFRVQRTQRFPTFCGDHAGRSEHTQRSPDQPGAGSVLAQQHRKRRVGEQRVAGDDHRVGVQLAQHVAAIDAKQRGQAPVIRIGQARDAAGENDPDVGPGPGGRDTSTREPSSVRERLNAAMTPVTVAGAGWDSLVRTTARPRRAEETADKAWSSIDTVAPLTTRQVTAGSYDGIPDTRPSNQQPGPCDSPFRPT